MISVSTKRTYPLIINNNSQMQQYKTQVVSYLQSSITAVRKYMQSTTTPLPTDPLPLLAHHLHRSGIAFRTQHTSQHILIDRLVMMYGEVRDSGYGTLLPVGVTAPGQQPAGVTIAGKLHIKANKADSHLQLMLLLHENVQLQPPLVLISNPSAIDYMPHPQYIHSGVYEVVLGGLRVGPAGQSQLQARWSKYNKSNLLQLVKYVHRTMQESFPYMKRVHKMVKPIYEMGQFGGLVRFKEEMGRVLASTQKLAILKACLLSQTKYLQQQSDQMHSILSASSEDTSIVQLFRVQQNQQLMQLVSEQRALRDSENELYNLADQHSLQFEQVKQHLQGISARVFQARYKIALIVDRYRDELLDTFEPI